MDEDQLIYEISVLLKKVIDSENLVRRMEAFCEAHRQQWHYDRLDTDAYLQDWMERKRDQIDYEWYRIKRMGQAVAAGRNWEWFDI